MTSSMTSGFIALLSLEPDIERTDHELLRAFATGSEGAFVTLVRPHIDVVYSSAHCAKSVTLTRPPT